MNQCKGVIYVMTNPSFPEYVKIGYADDVEKRLKQLNRSETIPFAFRIYAVYEVTERLSDLELHRLIDKLNPELRAIDTFDGKNRVKEFYAITAEEAYSLLECIAKISGTEDRLHRLTPEGHEILDVQIAREIRETSRKEPFRFSFCNIPIGSELIFLDDESVKVTVVDDRHILYNGETTSLSALAQKLKGTTYPVQGTMWFTYHGVKLADLRERMDSNDV